MNGELLFAALNEAAPEDILQAGRAGGYLDGKKRGYAILRLLPVAAIVLILLAGAVGAKMVLGIWNDRWVQTPALKPETVVQSAIENQTQKEYTVSIQVNSIQEDPTEEDKVWTGSKNSVLARQNGWTDFSDTLEKLDRRDFKVFYAEYDVEYDHEKTFYSDGTLGQWFYLIRGADGNWVIWDSCDPISLAPVSEETGQPNAEMPDTDGAVDEAIRIVKAWEQFEDVGSITVEKAYISPEQKELAIQYLNGSNLMKAEKWTAEYLQQNLAAVEITYTTQPAPDPALPDFQPVTETAVFYLLRDPMTGQWSNSEITGFMDRKE